MISIEKMLEARINHAKANLRTALIKRDQKVNEAIRQGDIEVAQAQSQLDTLESLSDLNWKAYAKVTLGD